MSSDHFSCGCPFCSPKRITFEGINISKSLSLWILVFALLLRGSVGTSVSIESLKPEDGNKAAPISEIESIPSQIMKIRASEATNCGSDNCNCYGIGKCKPCSRFDVGRQLRECLLTGYKQRAYCPSTKHEQFIGCHYTPNPFDTRMFWLFEGSALSLGAIAYAIVYLRQRKIEKMVARRIQEQINA